MKRHLTPILVGALLLLLCVWVARNTYWTDVEIPMRVTTYPVLRQHLDNMVTLYGER